MKRFLILLFYVTSPICVMGVLLEFYSRDNTYQAKSDYVELHKDSIELLVLGTSHNWRAINPEYLNLKTAQLAHGGSVFNIDYLLFKKFVPKLPRLKVVIMEVSYHTLERYRNSKWNQNHLFYLYYGINNYGKVAPVSEHFLVTANPKGYLKQLFTTTPKHNQYGYLRSFSSLVNKNYDTSRLYSTPSLKRRHKEKNMTAYKKNTAHLDEMVNECLSKNIKVVLLSPPNFYLYNRHMDAEKLKRRDDVLEKYKPYKDVSIWNYETLYEYKSELFFDPDHLNSKGAARFSTKLNTDLKALLNEE